MTGGNTSTRDLTGPNKAFLKRNLKAGQASKTNLNQAKTLRDEQLVKTWATSALNLQDEKVSAETEDGSKDCLINRHSSPEMALHSSNEIEMH